MDNNIYTCIPPSLSERTLGEDSNRPSQSTSRENLPLPRRLEGGRKETNLQRRRDWGEGACHCSSGTAVSAASQAKAQQKAFSPSLLSLSLPFLPSSLFFFLLLKQNSFLFSSFHSKKSSSFSLFLSTLLSLVSFLFPSFSILLSKIVRFLSLSLFYSHEQHSPASSLLSDTQNFTISPSGKIIYSLLTPPTSSKENRDSLFSILSFTFSCIVLLRKTVYS